MSWAALASRTSASRAVSSNAGTAVATRRSLNDALASTATRVALTGARASRKQVTERCCGRWYRFAAQDGQIRADRLLIGRTQSDDLTAAESPGRMEACAAAIDAFSNVTSARVASSWNSSNTTATRNGTTAGVHS